MSAIMGIFPAILTPVSATGATDPVRLAAHSKWLLANGCDGIALFGTTGEAASFSAAERMAALERLLAAGISPSAVILGVGCPDVPTTIELARHGFSLGVRRFLVLPPYYFKNVSDEGVFAAFAAVIDGLGEAAANIILYHFPQMSAVPVSLAVIERLLKQYGAVVYGIKDSSGDFANMETMQRAFPELRVLSGSDDLLLPVLRAGGAGCIAAVANLAAPVLARVLKAHRAGRGDVADAAQAEATAIKAAFRPYPLAPALKAVMAAWTGDVAWCPVRPPLVALGRDDTAALLAALAPLDCRLVDIR